MRTLVVTAADDAFAPLLRGLVESLQMWAPRPYTNFACLDVGLSAENRSWVARYAAHIVSPGWDLPVDAQMREAHPAWRAMTARPFLPHYFPGYDIYLWIDADAWLQEPFAFDWYNALASKGPLAAVPEVDRAYRIPLDVVEWRTSRMRAYFGPQAEQRTLCDRYFNSGVFALRAGAPHWTQWAKWFRTGLDATAGKVCSDQTALNQAIWEEGLPVAPLPALCNWLCHLAVPVYDPQRGRFREPVIPGNPIGILHLAGVSKRYVITLRGEGVERRITLRFPGPAEFQRVPAGAADADALRPSRTAGT
jgi:lipopolysaccharide biosynthesis glycosyltransferase